jgi:hypothetical protein
MREQQMSFTSDRPNETWIPTPLGLATLAFAIQTLRRADRSELAAVCVFAFIGLTATLIAAAVGGSAFDYGSILTAAG